MKPKARRAAETFAAERFGLSHRRACQLVQLCRATQQYRAKRKSDELLRKRMRELAEQRRRFGSPRLHIFLRREGLVQNHKRTERLYREEGLSLRLKKRKKKVAMLRIPLPVPQKPNEIWAMDFVSDAFFMGRRFRILTLIDLFSRECLAIEVDTSIGGARVSRVLDRVAEGRTVPAIIMTDNGPEFTGQALDEWAQRRGVKQHFIRPGKPTENAFIESFNGKFRMECLDVNWFTSLQQAREIIEAWRIDFNRVRPHSSLNDLTPEEFAESAA